MPDDLVSDVASALAYAAITNEALVVRSKLNEAAANYPDVWKSALKVAVQNRKDEDPEYADALLESLS